MVVTSSKTLTEAYWDMVNKSSSSGLVSASNHITEQVELPATDFTAGTPCIICPSSMIREAIEYHDMGLMEKLTCKIMAWLHKHAD